MAASVELTVTDPRDGTVVVLETHESDLLCELALELRDREQDLKRRRERVEAEMRDRLERHGRREATVGNYTVALDSSRAREWDACELEGVLAQLVVDDVVQAGEVADVIQTQRKVSGKAAQRLLGQLTGAARAAVEDCFRWRDRGTPKLTIERRQLERGG